jgi:head-tail adaptor
MGTGDYRHRFAWLQSSRTEDTTTGDRPRSYTNQGNLWGSIDLESATEETQLGAVRETTYGTVRFRGWVGVSAMDRLVWNQFNETFIVDGVRRSFATYETVCDVHKLTGSAT